MKRVTKVLFCSANPSETSRLRLDKEYSEIDNSLRASSYRDEVELLAVWATTTQDLLHRIISYEPSIVHFSGHGTHSGIVLENSIGNKVIVSKTGLGALFELFLGKINCVILNSCYSQTQAELISSFVPYVIGMNDSLQDSAAIAFSSGFYKAIGAGRDVSESFKTGVTSIKLEGFPNKDIPLLLINTELQQKLENIKFNSQNTSTENAVRFDSDKCIIALDIDDFTVINKKFGWVVGDEIKNIIFGIIDKLIENNKLRAIHNWIVDFSDEHYIAVQSNISSAIRIANQIRDQINNYTWHTVSPDLYVSVCCSVVNYYAGESPEEVLIKSLLGVKEAKMKSKNSTIVGPKYLPSRSNHLAQFTIGKWTSSGYEYDLKYGNHRRLDGCESRQFNYLKKEFRKIDAFFKTWS